MGAHPRQGVTNHHFVKNDVVNATALPCDLKREVNAEIDNANYLEAVNALFVRWEAKHGFRSGAARILLPAGWQE